MKNLVTILAIGIFMFTSAYSQNENLADYLNSLPEQELVQTEIDGIILMREEEKLARDVYLALYDKWSTNIFNNIASSEQTHMDWVGVLIEKYGLDDPMQAESGAFTDSHMQELYDALVATGSESVEQALFIGCTIEDLDIYDLSELISETDNIDVQTVYQNLMLGSRNHMRSFYRQYENKGLTYSEQYITNEELAAILDSDMENGPVDHNGDPLDLNDVEESYGTSGSGNPQAMNYPNPFSSQTTISFGLNTASRISVVIFDNLGNVVRNLINNEYYEAGTNSFSWDAAANSGITPAYGTYTYHIYTDNDVIVGRMVFVE